MPGRDLSQEPVEVLRLQQIPHQVRGDGGLAPLIGGRPKRLITGRCEADVHLHVHKENNVLFPQVVPLESER